MKIRILTITHKTPAWVVAGYEEYAKRLPPSYALELIEVAAEKRSTHSNIQRIIEKEGEKLLSHSKPTHRIIALDVNGKAFSTEQLAEHISDWQQDGRPIDLMVGGPDGLSSACLAKADLRWSLSPLTFPHFLIRVMLAEQLYRAYTILSNHPYNR